MEWYTDRAGFHAEFRREKGDAYYINSEHAMKRISQVTIHNCINWY